MCRKMNIRIVLKRTNEKEKLKSEILSPKRVIQILILLTWCFFLPVKFLFQNESFPAYVNPLPWGMFNSKCVFFLQKPDILFFFNRVFSSMEFCFYSSSECTLITERVVYAYFLSLRSFFSAHLSSGVSLLVLSR